VNTRNLHAERVAPSNVPGTHPFGNKARAAMSLSVCIAAVLGQAQLAHAQDTEAGDASALEEVVVTGFRQSLENSTAAKREAVSFVDAIFAEDIGKFPDTNIAESFNRIPGITISRETSGEGLNVAIRGLGTNFTKVLLNGAPVAVASTGRTDAQSTNREVDLDMFPTELFSQLTVSKTPTASMLEGGAAGTVNMRSARPFDNEGAHITYSIQGMDNSKADDLGARGSIVASNTWGSFGVLVGMAGVHNKVRTTGFETIGWTNPNLIQPSDDVPVENAQCRGSNCNSTGGGNFTIPNVVPSNAGNGLTPGAIINQELLLALNPGRTLEQIDNALIPRLGRPAVIEGDRDRYNAIASFEFRPSESFHAYLDTMYGKKENDLERIDMNLVGRNGAMIPINMQVDREDCSQGCVVTSATFANAQAFLEYRPFLEDTEFYGANPGFTWQIADRLSLNWQADYTRSTFHRESPTLLVSTPPNSGMTVNYTNNGGIPVIESSLDLNDPSNFGWVGGRVNMQDEKRKTETKGTRASLTYGDSALSITVGGAYDDVQRRIRAFDNSAAWQNAVCGNNPNIELPQPNSQPPCNGAFAPGPAPEGFPTYPGLGTGYSVGFPALNYQGSLIPQSALINYLRPGPGFITANWNAFARDSMYDAFHNATPEAGSSNTGANGGLIREKSTGFFTEVNGDVDIGEHRLRYNVGVRYVTTDQIVGGRVTFTDPRNILPNGDQIPDGARYPNLVNFVELERSYENWLPAANVAFNATDNVVLRAALSRTMTRANPNDMLPGLGFSSPSADVGTVGNPDLKPFISDNIDIGFEFYTGAEGYIGATAFRKGIDGFTVLGSQTVPFRELEVYGVTFNSLTPTQQEAINSRGGPDVATVVLQQQVNAPGRLTVNGLELNWVQPLDFLLAPIGIEGFGFTANYTIVDQKGEGAAPAVAIGVAPETYNATIYYENHGISARLSTTFAEGSQASGFNQNGIPLAALYGDDYQQWDFSSSFDLSEMFGISEFAPQITVDVINLFNEEQRSYFQFPNATFTQYEPGRTVIVGVRGRF
jgi:TonB-dependent receptor